MDPLTLANTYATVVGLICNFRQERGSAEALDSQKFFEWLEYHRHEEIKNLICSTASLRAEIDTLLRADHAVIMQKLDTIGNTLATLVSQIVEFRGLTQKMVPGAELSDQAIFILRRLVNSTSSYFIKIKAPDGAVLQLERGGRIEQTEPRFLDDDLNKLTGLGLLGLELGAHGVAILRITRNSARLIEAIDGREHAV